MTTDTSSDCCSQPGLQPLSSAQKKMRDALTDTPALLTTEQVPVATACGRVLANDIISPMAVPPHDNSAMDGYALRATDLADTDTLPVAGECLAGHPFLQPVPEGQCLRIMTGAPLPADLDTVVMQEQTRKTENGIQFCKKPREGANVRRAGEDIMPDSLVLPAGRNLRPQDLGLLASLGIAEVSVQRRLKVAIFSTGDELKLPGQKLETGEIYDSNRFLVQAMLEQMGVEVLNLGCIADDPELLRKAFLDADEQADAVITSGGVSVGDADYTKDILEQEGSIGFWKLAIKPGKPFAFGRLKSSWFFGLPGNPVSATVTLHQLVVPALKQLAGETAIKPVRYSATCLTPLKKGPGRMEFQRGIVSRDEAGQLQVVTTGSQGSGILRSMSQANCYIVLEQEQGSVEAGSEVLVQPFDALL